MEPSMWQIRDFVHISKVTLCKKLQTEPSSVAFDHTGTLVALCCDRIVQVFVADRSEVLVTLEGHLARVTKCAFHPIHHHLLITCSEDRTFKIWDLAAKALLFQSSVLSAFAILSLAMNPRTGDFSIGFADGTIRIFSLLGNFAKEMMVVNVESFLRKLLWRKQV
uniref:Uncharacterized protein n=1 Tax=Globisporangium ultimum (strain ATCC 200006 / CBS 805.95 / DAOM BR144) TaxID=431595 RepID=K3WJZ5_GLOUD